VQVPSVLERFVQLNSSTDRVEFILLEDLIGYFIHNLFNGYDVVSISVFRITRKADLTMDEEGAHDLLKDIEKELRKRRWDVSVRLEIQQTGFSDRVLRNLTRKLEIQQHDVYQIDGPLDLTIFFNFY
jgi:polyphosphate kinase